MLSVRKVAQRTGDTPERVAAVVRMGEVEDFGFGLTYTTSYGIELRHRDGMRISEDDLEAFGKEGWANDRYWSLNRVAVARDYDSDPGWSYEFETAAQLINALTVWRGAVLDNPRSAYARGVVEALECFAHNINLEEVKGRIPKLS